MTGWRRLRERQGRYLGKALSHPARSPGLGRRHRSEPGLRGQRRRARRGGGGKTGPNPTDRGRAGSKRHAITDLDGIPFALRLTAANIHDSRIFEELIDAVPPTRHGVDRPRHRPAKLHANKGCDFPQCRGAPRRRAIQPRIARPGRRQPRASGTASPGGGTNARLVQPHPPADNPLRATPRPLRSLSPSHRRPHLPPLRPAVLLGDLNPS
jgi:hypothetical protein